jgi:tetratricopeptide (TPR) repeat protein
VALNTVGHLYIKVEEPEKAEPFFIEAEGIFGDLIDRVPTSDEFRRGLAMVRFGLAEAAYQRQQWTQAIDLYSEAIAAFLSQKAGLRRSDRDWIQKGYLRQASAYQSLGNPLGMQTSLQLARSIGP